MTRPTMIRISNLALFLAVVLQLLTAAVIFFGIKPLDGSVMDLIHAYNGFLLAALTVVHIVLHWPSFRAMFLLKK